MGITLSAIVEISGSKKVNTMFFGPKGENDLTHGIHQRNLNSLRHVQDDPRISEGSMEMMTFFAAISMEIRMDNENWAMGAFLRHAQDGTATT